MTNRQVKKWTTGIALICLLTAAVCSCTLHGRSTVGDGNGSAESGPVTNRPLDFTLVNLTGWTVQAIYLSPHDSATWEENVLGADALLNGHDVPIRFSPKDETVMWDLRVQFKHERRTGEWRNLNLREISRITLRTTPAKEVLIAEAE